MLLAGDQPRSEVSRKGAKDAKAQRFVDKSLVVGGLKTLVPLLPLCFCVKYGHKKR